MSTRIRLLTSVAFAALVLAAAMPAQADKVGVTAAVNPQASGKPPQQAERVLQVGIDMQADERVVTNANGRAQLLFLDGSGLTVGPNSDLKIDKFVYDPTSKTGDLAVTAAKGVFRFVGGKISKTSEVQINTPAGTIGIRGGIATVAVSPTGATTANFLFGQKMTMRAAGMEQVVTRPGTAVDGSPGQPPSAPRPSTSAELQQVNSSLQTSGEGGNGQQTQNG
ncbi:MAG TPA: FecR domain-containing protein, partial [Candidatus Omnitrophota bacterium]|nr:FecR domain-containing protein [Candidatus Omnitrophota bacterium]